MNYVYKQVIQGTCCIGLKGNNVRDEFGLAATFPEESSGASYAIFSKILDAVLIFFCCGGGWYAEHFAYTRTQSDMFECIDASKRPAKYIQLLIDQWRPSWHKIKKEPTNSLYVNY